VEEIERILLELEHRHEDPEDPIVLVDAVGRKFLFPFERCRSWGVCFCSLSLLATEVGWSWMVC